MTVNLINFVIRTDSFSWIPAGEELRRQKKIYGPGYGPLQTETTDQIACLFVGLVCFYGNSNSELY